MRVGRDVGTASPEGILLGILRDAPLTCPWIFEIFRKYGGRSPRYACQKVSYACQDHLLPPRCIVSAEIREIISFGQCKRSRL